MGDEVVVVADTATQSTPTPVECHSCGYEWDTESALNRVTCPSCSRKTPVDREEQ